MRQDLKTFLKEQNLTQGDLARKLRVSRTSVSFYLSGKRQPGRKTARRLAKLTGIPLLDILYPVTKRD